MSAIAIDGELAWVLPDGTTYFAGGDNANCTVSACPIELSVYGYRPSIAASSALIALYGLCMLAQLVQGLRYKTWWFMSSMLLGCASEILGYVGRILYWQNPWGGTGFIMQIVLITIAPVFFSAAVYVLLSKIVLYISPRYSRVHPRRYIWIFLSCDIVSLVLQAVGGAMSSTSNGADKSGVDIALAGLSFQLVTLFVFVVLVVDYFVRSRAVWKAIKLPLQFKVFCGTLAAATIFILIRCAYRIYELSEGYSRDSAALRDENLFVGLESVMVILAAYCLVASHPGPVFKDGVLPPSTEARPKEETIISESAAV